MYSLLNKSHVKIMLEIFRNPGINLREIISRTKLSPNFVSKYINHLVERRIVREEKLEKKRVYLRRFFLDFGRNSGRNYFRLVKEEERELFFRRYSNLRTVFRELENEVNMGFVLVYGSYARLEASEESDIDILVVGRGVNREKIREIFVSLDIDVSIKVESLKDFKRRAGDALHQQIFKEGVAVFDEGGYFDFVYGILN